MKQTIEVNVKNGEVESYMIPIPMYTLANLKVTLYYNNGVLSYYFQKENVIPDQIKYYLGFLTGVCFGQVMGDMLISENQINGKLVIESEDVI